MLSRLFLALMILFAGALIGLGLGLYIGWQAWPVSYNNTDVSSMRPDYQDDYVVMIATSYAWDGDLERARSLLERLGGSPLGHLEDTRARVEGRPERTADAQRVSRLAADLRRGTTATPSASPSARPLPPPSKATSTRAP